ncbi:MAG: uracil phosphoribosyltransferase [Planctomycetota bacterium]
MSTRTDEHPNLVLFDHPLILHKLTHIRDRDTGHRAFRALMAQIAGLMVYEATRSFRTEEVEVQTPIEPFTGRRLAATVTLVPVLRAGLGMTDGILDLMPEARVGHLGLARDEQTLQPKAYLNKLPSDLDAGPVVLVDPMLATGGSALAAIEMIKQAGARDVRMLCIVASPEGVQKLAEAAPGVTIYAASLDRELNDKGYIVPGLGDAGDRLFGTT